MIDFVLIFSAVLPTTVVEDEVRGKGTVTVRNLSLQEAGLLYMLIGYCYIFGHLQNIYVMATLSDQKNLFCKESALQSINQLKRFLN